VTSGKSDFESATGSPAHKPTSFIDAIEGGPQVETKRIQTELVKYLEGGPQDDSEENPLVESSYFTEPRPDQPYSPIKNLFSAIRTFNQLLPIQTITMAQLTNGTKELNVNKPEAFDGNQNNFEIFYKRQSLHGR
jgi:hypothetical protein